MATIGDLSQNDMPGWLSGVRRCSDPWWIFRGVPIEIQRCLDLDLPGLFLDEAYALMDSAAGVGGAGDAFSQEALRRSRSFPVRQSRLNTY